MQLTSLEYQILEFVSQKGIIRKSEIFKHFETAPDIELCIMRLTLPTPNIYNLPPDKTRYLDIIHENSLSNDYKLKLTSYGCFFSLHVCAHLLIFHFHLSDRS